MTSLKILTTLAFACIAFFACAQRTIQPELSKITDKNVWAHYNRDVTYTNAVHMNAKSGDGVAWLKNVAFSNGTIEADLKGRDEAGRSFVGLAFHGSDEKTYDAVYFRPFNFKNAERNGHSVQYVSHPNETWSKLREQYPGKFENKVSPVPDPSDWFHVRIVVDYPVVNVFVNDSKEPTLTVSQLSTRKEGWIGFWTGNNSEGDFRNLKITAR
jgi:hypothetical protein